MKPRSQVKVSVIRALSGHPPTKHEGRSSHVACGALRDRHSGQRPHHHTTHRAAPLDRATRDVTPPILHSLILSLNRAEINLIVDQNLTLITSTGTNCCIIKQNQFWQPIVNAHMLLKRIYQHLIRLAIAVRLLKTKIHS